MPNTSRQNISTRRRFLALLGTGGAGIAAACASRSSSGTADDPHVQATFAALVGSNIRWADTVQELKDTGHDNTWAHAVVVAGYYTPADGGGGLFIWDASVSTPDEGVLFRPGTASGCWRRIFSGAVNIRWFGARSDAAATQLVADANSTAIQSAVDFLKTTGGEVFIPAGTYVIWKVIKLDQKQSLEAHGWYNNVSLVGEGAASCIKAGRACLEASCEPFTLAFGIVHFIGWNCYQLRNVGVRSLRISGLDDGQGGVHPSFAHQIVSFAGTDGSYAIDCMVDTSHREGFYWNGTDSNIIVRGNHATRVGNWSGTGPFGYKLSAYNINAFNVTMTGNVAYQVGQAIEHTQAGGIIAHNLFAECSAVAINVQTTQWERRLIVQSNVIRDCPTAILLNRPLGAVLVADNIIERCGGGIVGGNFDNPIAIRGNLLFDAPAPPVGDPPLGAAIHREAFEETCGRMPAGCGGPDPTSDCTVPVQPPAVGPPGILRRPSWAVIEDNFIVRGPTSSWNYGIRTVNSHAYQGDLITGNVELGDVAVYPFQAGNAWTQHEFSENYLRPLSPTNVFPAGIGLYYWTPDGYWISQDDMNGASSGPKIRAVGGSEIDSASQSQPTGQRWSVGDTVRNSEPVELGTAGSRYIVRAWVCVQAGPPPQWRELRARTGT